VGITPFVGEFHRLIDVADDVIGGHISGGLSDNCQSTRKRRQ
jgi:hypothetical protein